MSTDSKEELRFQEMANSPQRNDVSNKIITIEIKDEDLPDPHLERLQRLKHKPSFWRRVCSRFVGISSWVYLAFVLVLWGLLWSLADVWWPVTLLAFGPRYVLLTPALLLLPFALFTNCRSLIPLVASAVIIVWPIMGLCIPWSQFGGNQPSEESFKLITCNMGEGGQIDELQRMITEESPHLVVVQESPKASWEQFETDGWNVEKRGEFTLLSRFPVAVVEEVRCEPPNDWRILAIKYRISGPNGEFDLINTHPTSSRNGLEAILGDKLAGVSVVIENSELRMSESQRIRKLFGGGPTIVAGDFNVPVESKIYQDCWGDFVNAYSETGMGYGFTKLTRWHGVRIDHVIVKEFSVQACEVGPSLGGDHLPLISHLALP